MIDGTDNKDNSSTEEFDFDILKKKKKNKKVAFSSDNDSLEDGVDGSEDVVKLVSDGDAEVDEMTNMFANLKKKKKSFSNFEDSEEDLKELGENDEKELLNDIFDLGEGMKKKKKKKVNMEAFETSLSDSNTKDHTEHVLGSISPREQDEQAWLKTDRDYTYAELLAQVFKVLRQNNPELASEKKRYTIAPPTIYREGNKKTIFANVIDICKRMHRNSDHVIQFLFAELGTSGSVDGSARLVIKGKFQQKQIENVLKRYIVEYVTCKICKSPDTLLTKENRIYFMTCESCGSKRSVSAIKTGFRAQTEKRKR
ncbi:translation initiation factor eIF2 subunit beta [Pneumocystis jirovecii RU7]|uniref:Translation initiation factor IF2/IF5 domain-containing protein n=1 Tax=Pneumocystis jirovecii (strain RU7) TaxID=1408657 RepID=A0A0W4ZNL1_PNEJ7|nr:translation initiation factor eIF2 subunit beta [Pneumocystis jirovecii RU7]KTW29963.1 hypothetical protein T551_01907 [Pneumocystis jirovecii RU7]